MDLIALLLYITVFVFVVAICQGLFLAWSDSKFIERRKVKKRLMYISAGGKHGQEKLEVYRSGVLKQVSPFERFIFSLPRLSDLDKLLIKSNLPINATLFILISIAFGLVGFILGYYYLGHLIFIAILVSLVFLVLPYFSLKLIEKSYYQKFNEALPEALDLLARAVRSGNALVSGLAMVAEEMTDPIKSEFAATVDEINLGLTMNEAMENLNERVPLADLRFFSVAVLIQKDTGGNIGEILDNISRLIRQRIEFKRHVQALTAEGRYSAIILIGLPIFMFFYMYTTNFEYLSLLWKEETGQYMLFGAIIMQIIGAYVIKRIVDIEI